MTRVRQVDLTADLGPVVFFFCIIVILSNRHERIDQHPKMSHAFVCFETWNTS